MLSPRTRNVIAAASLSVGVFFALQAMNGNLAFLGLDSKAKKQLICRPDDGMRKKKGHARSLLRHKWMQDNLHIIGWDKRQDEVENFLLENLDAIASTADSLMQSQTGGTKFEGYRIRAVQNISSSEAEMMVALAWVMSERTGVSTSALLTFPHYETHMDPQPDNGQGAFQITPASAGVAFTASIDRVNSKLEGAGYAPFDPMLGHYWDTDTMDWDKKLPLVLRQRRWVRNSAGGPKGEVDIYQHNMSNPGVAFVYGAMTLLSKGVRPGEELSDERMATIAQRYNSTPNMEAYAVGLVRLYRWYKHLIDSKDD